MPKKHVTIPIFIPHHGCPHRCYFCNQNATSGKLSKPSEEEVISTIEMYLENINPSVKDIEIAFFGGSFTGLPIEEQIDYLKIASNYFLDKKINGIRLSTRPDYIDKSKLDLLKEYNVTTIELGIQSFNDCVLSKSNRGHSSTDSIEAIKLIKEKKFKFVIQLMPGLPASTDETILDSAERASEMKPNAVRIYPAVVLKDTILERMYLENKFKPLDIEKAVDICSKLYSIFEEQNINVIRLGLHPFSESEVRNIIAGPYHPSFGFMVKSRIRRNEIENKIIKFLKKNRGIEYLEINIPHRNKEEYIGTKKNNISYLQSKFNLKKLTYSIDGDELKIIPPIGL